MGKKKKAKAREKALRKALREAQGLKGKAKESYEDLDLDLDGLPDQVKASVRDAALHLRDAASHLKEAAAVVKEAALKVKDTLKGE